MDDPPLPVPVGSPPWIMNSWGEKHGLPVVIAWEWKTDWPLWCGGTCSYCSTRSEPVGGIEEKWNWSTHSLGCSTSSAKFLHVLGACFQYSSTATSPLETAPSYIRQHNLWLLARYTMEVSKCTPFGWAILSDKRKNSSKCCKCALNKLICRGARDDVHMNVCSSRGGSPTRSPGKSSRKKVWRFICSLTSVLNFLLNGQKSCVSYA